MYKNYCCVETAVSTSSSSKRPSFCQLSGNSILRRVNWKHAEMIIVIYTIVKSRYITLLYFVQTSFHDVNLGTKIKGIGKRGKAAVDHP